MVTRNLLRKSVVTATTLLLMAVPAAVHAGNLEPDAPPAPTMKTLDEVEPRTPIHADDIPFLISQPGSYYLAEDIDCSGAAGFLSAAIMITSGDVSLDLRGFALDGGGGLPAVVSGIAVINGLKSNVRIHNGIVSGWSGHGVDAVYAHNSQLATLRVFNNGNDNGYDGIRIGHGSTVIDCVTEDNAGNGIRVQGTVLVTDCVSRKNGGNGIMAGGGCPGNAVVNCNVTDNGGAGITLLEDSLVRGCVVRANEGIGIVTDDGGSVITSTATRNGGGGIQVGDGSIVKDCVVRRNSGTGIEVSKDCQAFGNVCSWQTTGIHASGGDNRVDSNHVAGNTTGIDTETSGQYNVIVRNTAMRNSTNYSCAWPFQMIGEIDSGIGYIGEDVGAWANFKE